MRFRSFSEYLRSRLKPTLAALASGAGCVLWASCATPPIVSPPSITEQWKAENAEGLELAQALEPQLEFVSDPEVSGYLTALARHLTSAHAELKMGNPGIFVLRDHDAGRWRSYGLPGTRVYLSVGLIKTVRYENELAAAIALQLAHVLRHHAVERARKPEASPPSEPMVSRFFGPEGIFDFTDTQVVEATRSAVDLLYAAGFDPRGVVSVWERFQASPKRSPFSPSRIRMFIDATRSAIDNHAPLLNPVVRSNAFVKVYGRIQRL